MVGKIFVVGAGPGSPDYVTPAARKAVQKAQLTIGAERALVLFKEDIREEILQLTAKNMMEGFKKAMESAKAGKVVAMLSIGDPGFSGLLKPILKRSSELKEDIEIEVVPGVSSILLCAARLQLCWDEVDLFLSFHAKTELEKKAKLVTAVKEGKSVLLLPDPKSFPPDEIAKFLLSEGINGGTAIAVCEDLTYPQERVITSTLKSVSRMVFSDTCVMAIGKTTSKKINDCYLKRHQRTHVGNIGMWKYKTPGIPDNLFIRSKEVPMSKEEIRALTISKARLHDGAYVIDVGCGTGSLSIEAALQVSTNGKVFAIDKDGEAIKLTKENATRFNVQNIVQIIHHKAPEAMRGLPEVDTVIIGGGSDSLEEIIDVSTGKLKTGGRIVINAILVESAYAAIGKLRMLGFEDLDVTQVYITKGKKTDAGTMMLARNPITIVSATKPGGKV